VGVYIVRISRGLESVKSEYSTLSSVVKSPHTSSLNLQELIVNPHNTSYHTNNHHATNKPHLTSQPPTTAKMPHSYNTRSTTHSSTTSPTSSPNSSPASFLPPTPPPSRTNDALPLLSSATLLAEAAKRAQMACLLRDMEGCGI
jgi:hypothetical protein